MNEGLLVHTLKQFKLSEVDRVWLALINISDTIQYNEYISLDRIYPEPGEEISDDSYSYLKYEVQTSGKVNFIFNSILVFNKRAELLCYANLDPQNLGTVDSWVVKISTAYDITTGNSDYSIDYLAVYKEHTSNTRDSLTSTHDNLNLDEAISVSKARLYSDVSAQTRYIDQTINTVSTQAYDSVERLVIPAKQDEGQNTLIKRYLNNRSATFRYQDLVSQTPSSSAIEGITGSTIQPSKIVDSLSTGVLLTYFTPRIALEVINNFNQDVNYDDWLTYQDIAQSYKYGSVFVDNDTGAGFFVPIYKHYDPVTDTVNDNGHVYDTVHPAKKTLRGCVIIPNGINKEIQVFRFTEYRYLEDDEPYWDEVVYDFKRIPPKYYPMKFVHTIQFMNGKAISWSKHSTPDITISDDSKTDSCGVENPWVYINSHTGIKTDEEQETSFILHYTRVTAYASNMYLIPSLTAAGIYLGQVAYIAPIEYTEFKNYCINTRDKILTEFTSNVSDLQLKSVVRNYISYSILSQADEAGVITSWSGNLTNDVFTYRIAAGASDFCTTHEDLFKLQWGDILKVYSETGRPSDYNKFANFKSTHSGKSQRIVLPVGVEGGDPDLEYLDRPFSVPEQNLDVINPISHENVKTHAILNQIGDGIKSHLYTMTQDISESVNTYICRTLYDYERTDMLQWHLDPGVKNDIDLELMACDNGILEVRDDDQAIYVTVIKYSSKANTPVFRQVINKSLLEEGDGAVPYFNVSYSNNILCYRMLLKDTQTAYTSFYDLTKVNPFVPVLSNRDKFECTEDTLSSTRTLSFNICTLYHGYGMLFETEYTEQIPTESIYNRYEHNHNYGTDIVEAHGRKLIRREYFLPDD